MQPERWQRIEQLYHAALERGANERAAFLAEACAGDNALRREVESLLLCDARAEHFIESPALEIAAQLRAGERAQSMIGRQLDHYQILSLLGAGGMGEVYRARDSRLGREVAIKVLPAAFAQDADRLRRFEQEARAAGMLNHPNVLTVHDIGMHDGAPYIVSELLEGETLRERLSEAALPMRKAIDYAQQIARGLAAAHEKGIVHRDLKPENLFVTKDGRVKILDFGLAKLRQPRVGGSVDKEAPTQKARTDPGVVMGTVGYMSPEQVRGQEADHRADIFAFGAILYEMLTGRRAFEGKSAVETMNAILNAEPPELAETSPQIPPALERLMRHCLEKSPEQRFHSIGDVAFDLEGMSGLSGSTPASLVPARGRQKSRELLAWILAAVAALTAVALGVLFIRRAPTDVGAIHLSLLPPEKSVLTGSVVVSPDGKYLAFVAATSGGKDLLWIRKLDTLSAQALPGTEDAAYPFWSPDGRSLGFFAQGKLKRIDIAGGSPQTLCDSLDGRGGTWNRDGVIVFARNFQGGLYRISATGGIAAPLTTLDASRLEDSHRWPQFLPDGRRFLYYASSGRSEFRGIYVGSLDEQERKYVLNTGASAAYAAPGYLLFVREGTLVAQSFDADQLRTAGEPVRLAQQVYYDGWVSGRTAFSASENGILAYRSSFLQSAQLIWFDRTGKQLGSAGPQGVYVEPCLSPDEKKVAVSRLDLQAGTNDIWLFDLARNTPSRFTFDPADEATPVWSPDGSRIVFSSGREGFSNLYQRLSSGAGQDELLWKSDAGKFSDDWSGDGKFIIYENVVPETNFDLWYLPMFGDRKPKPFLVTEFNEAQGQFSPDGRWLAYVSDESGRFEVCVQSFPQSGAKWQISTGGGIQPKWRRDGKELFYLTPDRKLMAVEMRMNSSSVKAGAAKFLFNADVPYADYGPTQQRNHYVVSAGGKRFLIKTPVGDATPAAITVVVNWTAELKR